MSTTVVVVCRRPGDWLAPSLASVTGQADQVVVVDNGSDDAAASELGRAAGAEVVRSADNRGFAGGFELGRRQARGDHVAVLNDDAEADPDWLAASVAALEDPEVAAVTPRVVLAGWWGEVTLPDEPFFVEGDARPLGRHVIKATVDGVDVLDRTIGGGVHHLERNASGAVWRWTRGREPFYVPLGPTGTGVVELNDEPVAYGAVCRVLNHAGSALLAHGAATEIGLGAPDDGRLRTARDCFGFSGTAPVFRADALERVGSLASHFFAYNEDTDWCLRAHLAGYRIRYEPSAVVHHRLSATSGGAGDPLVALLAERNALLALVRSAPWDLAREAVSQRLAQRPKDAVRRSLLRHLPWAVATRATLRRRRRTTPAAVWQRWAGVDLTWDTSPVDPAWVAAHPAPATVSGDAAG